MFGTALKTRKSVISCALSVVSKIIEDNQGRIVRSESNYQINSDHCGFRIKLVTEAPDIAFDIQKQIISDEKFPEEGIVISQEPNRPEHIIFNGMHHPETVIIIEAK